MLNWTKEEINQKYEELCSYDYDSYYDKDLNGKIEEFATITSMYQEAKYAYLAYRTMSEHGGEFNISKIFSLRLIIFIMSFVVVIVGGYLFYTMYFKHGQDLTFSIRKTAGAMIGMIPSGLLLTTSIALAIGVIKLTQRNVLVQELYCIEMLARVNCICLDKTGTITDGTMSVKNVIDYNTIHGLLARFQYG